MPGAKAQHSKEPQGTEPPQWKEGSSKGKINYFINNAMMLVVLHDSDHLYS